MLIKITAAASKKMHKISESTTAASVYKLPEVAVYQWPQRKRGSNKERERERDGQLLFITNHCRKYRERKNVGRL